MKLSVDTHIWLWYLIGSKELNKKYRNLLENSDSEIWLSPISIWEAHMLIERKRLPVSLPADKWISEALSQFPVNEAKLTFNIATRSRSISLPHSDPADRFIAATAIELGLTLITADKEIRLCKGLKLV